MLRFFGIILRKVHSKIFQRLGNTLWTDALDTCISIAFMHIYVLLYFIYFIYNFWKLNLQIMKSCVSNVLFTNPAWLEPIPLQVYNQIYKIIQTFTLTSKVEWKDIFKCRWLQCCPNYKYYPKKYSIISPGSKSILLWKGNALKKVGTSSCFNVKCVHKLCAALFLV